MAQVKDELMDDIINVLRKSDELVYNFRKEIENKKAIMFIGLTKSGKTTLVNYIGNQPLIAFQHGKSFKIKAATSDVDIGHNSTSHTTIPIVDNWENFVVIDSPGFDDNRGPLQEIQNALYINQIKYTKVIKFVLVCDMDSIRNDNVNSFLTFLRTVQTIFTNFNRLKHGVSIIFTKDDEDYTPQEISNMLNTKILDCQNLAFDTSLVKHFVQYVNLIGIFKMPSSVGELTEEIDCNISKAIFSSEWIHLNEIEVKYGISASARNILLDSYLSCHELVETIEAKLDCFKNRALSNFVKLNSEMFLVLLSDRQLEYALKILKLFVEEILKVGNIKSMDDIPNGLLQLLITNFCIILEELKNIIIDHNSESLNRDEIDEVTTKLEYIKCIEVIIEMSYKSNSVMKIYNDMLQELRRGTMDICREVNTEIEIRKHLLQQIKLLLKGEQVLETLSSTNLLSYDLKEWLRMKQQLNFLSQLLVYCLSELEKRPMLIQNLTPEVNRLLNVSQDIKHIEITLLEFIKRKIMTDLLQKLPPKKKSLYSKILLSVRMYNCLNYPDVKDCLKNYLVTKMNKLYGKSQKRGLLSKKTVLDDYIKLFTN